MSLSKYKTKRNFKESPEPTGGKADASQLRFVIQKHDASHLHYDFRLEMEGVLKSWAVPKGPSTDPAVKRLAMMVEDHPYDYRNFEGIIPSGYGAGTVIVWDEGFYEPVDYSGKDKTAQDKELRRQLHTGKLKFILKGKKLKGEYALVKAHGRGENGWLLFKVKDQHASPDDITLKDKSVLSKKTLAQIQKTSTNIYGSAKKKKEDASDKIPPAPKKIVATASPKKVVDKGKAAVEKSTETNTITNTDTGSILSQAPKAAFPKSFKPMLATLVDKPFEQEGWLYEVKWDGYRALALIKNGKVELVSRNDKSFNDKFYPVTKALELWNINAVLDGEVVVVGDNGISNFGSLQNWRSEADGELYYYVFDILWLNGKDLTALPLRDRKKILEEQIPEHGIIKSSEVFEASGLSFFEAAKKMGLEGIIAKKADSVYQPGQRSNDWLKIKANKRQEMVIGGYTKNDDSSKIFSALLVGVFDKGVLRYTGKIGTGFNDKTQREMLKQFKPLITKTPPFNELPDINKPSRFRPNPPHAVATWLKPELVCEVSFAEMTADGVMRHPSFEGMRVDKKAAQVVMENAAPAEQTVAKSNKKSEQQLIKPIGATERKSLLNPTEESQVKKINGHELKFNNLGKLYWPKEKITKRDMLNYYYQVAPYILPYLVNRPQSMNRHPNGIEGKVFILKT